MARLRQFGHRLMTGGRCVTHPPLEQGQTLVMFILLLPLLVVVVGLVVDGGLMYLTHRRANIAANLGAQAASHAIDEDYFRQTNRVRLDEARALSIAQQYASANSYAPIRVTGVGLQGRQVSVRATALYSTMFLRLVGLDGVTLRARGTAYAAYGIDWENQ